LISSPDLGLAAKGKLRLSSDQPDDQKLKDEKVSKPESTGSLEASAPEMSEAELETFLHESDPEFMKSIQGISSDKTLSITEEEITEGEAALKAEIEQWKSYKGFWKILYKVIPLAPHISYKSKNFRFKLKSIFFRVFIQSRNFIILITKKKIPDFVKSFKGLIHSISDYFGRAAHEFKYLKWQVKSMFYISTVLVIAAGYVIFKSIKNDFIKEEKVPFISSLGSLASHEYEFDEKEVEAYIDNARAAQNVILTRKVFVNLKPSTDSGPNPMAAFEFYIEGMNSDVVIEIKDREPKVQDIIQSTIEDMSFDDLESEQGKKELCKRLQVEVSKVLTTGSVKVVRIKTVILKP
jgi:flagellar basal body-associated protein FliL